MFEKVNPFHPDKVADRIAGAITDLCYRKNDNPKVATEVLIGHGLCTIITETSECITEREVRAIVKRIAGDCELRFVCVKQDEHLAKNQERDIRCGDNGIFKGMPVTDEQRYLAEQARKITERVPFDGKYIVNGDRLIICQSNATAEWLREDYPNAIINPLGDWTGGTQVDTGATNRKLGSDMGDSVTGGGLHGKDLSKADVSVNIFCHIWAGVLNHEITAYCAIGDEQVKIKALSDNISSIPYNVIVDFARGFVRSIGGFEAFAEWGLIR